MLMQRYGGTISLSLLGAGGIDIRGGDGNSVEASEGSGQSDNKVSAKAKLEASGNLSINKSGLLTVAGGANNQATASDGSTGPNVGTVAVDSLLQAGASLTVTAGGGIVVSGGDNNMATAFDNGTNTAKTTGNAEIVGQSISLNTQGAGVSVRGGNNGLVDASADSAMANQYASLQVNGLMAAGGNLDIDLGGGMLSVSGGGVDTDVDHGMAGPAVATAMGEANAALTAMSNLTVTNAGGVAIAGGNAHADVSDSAAMGTLTGSAKADALVLSGNVLSIQATGGFNLNGGTAKRRRGRAGPGRWRK